MVLKYSFELFFLKCIFEFMINTNSIRFNSVNSRKRYFNTINFQLILTRRLHSRVVSGRNFFAGGSWDAGSNPGVATSSFFFSFIVFFYPLAFYCLVSLLALLASRDFCENVFLVVEMLSCVHI